MTRTWKEIADGARAELRDRWENFRDEFHGGEPHDAIHEIADSAVPVYTMDRFELLADPAVGMHEISDPGILPEGGGLAEVVGVYIYDALQEELWEEWREIEDEQDDDEPGED